uniref:Uncharacterized protein n=1 Tax=Ciona savignyi TaxID=51511 RepID=H2YRS9_CIOSA
MNKIFLLFLILAITVSSSDAICSFWRRRTWNQKEKKESMDVAELDSMCQDMSEMMPQSEE